MKNNKIKNQTCFRKSSTDASFPKSFNKSFGPCFNWINSVLSRDNCVQSIHFDNNELHNWSERWFLQNCSLSAKHFPPRTIVIEFSNFRVKLRNSRQKLSVWIQIEKLYFESVQVKRRKKHLRYKESVNFSYWRAFHSRSIIGLDYDRQKFLKFCSIGWKALIPPSTSSTSRNQNHFIFLNIQELRNNRKFSAKAEIIISTDNENYISLNLVEMF